MQGAQLRKHIDATLGSGNLREAVKLPTGEDLNEWLAVNSISLFITLVACQFLRQFGLMNWYLEAKYVGFIGKVS